MEFYMRLIEKKIMKLWLPYKSHLIWKEIEPCRFAALHFWTVISFQPRSSYTINVGRKYFYEKHPQERSKMKSLNLALTRATLEDLSISSCTPLLIPDTWVFRSSNKQRFTSPAQLQFPSCILFASASSTSNKHPFTHCTPFLWTFSPSSQQTSLSILTSYDMIHW